MKNFTVTRLGILPLMLALAACGDDGGLTTSATATAASNATTPTTEPPGETT